MLEAVIDYLLPEPSAPDEMLELNHENLQEGMEFFAKKLLRSLITEKSLAIRRLAINEAQRRPDVGKIFFDHAVTPYFKLLEKY